MKKLLFKVQDLKNLTKNLKNEDWVDLTESYTEIKQEDYEDFWKTILENPDGSINKQQLAKELSDFKMLMENMSSLYCSITGSRCSYNTTMPAAVKELYDQEIQSKYDQGYEDAKADFNIKD